MIPNLKIDSYSLITTKPLNVISGEKKTIKAFTRLFFFIFFFYWQVKEKSGFGTN